MMYRCQQCEREFQSYPSKARKFCSTACHNESRMQQQSYRCERCEAWFQDVPSKQRRFCSRDCKDLVYSGEGSPTWRGDAASPEGARKRAYKYPRQPCEECGDPDGHRHHIDGDTYNNAPENIAFLCRGHHNKRHAREGTGVKGERQHLARLTADDVRLIRSVGLGVHWLAVWFEVDPTTIRRAMRGQTWKHVKTEAQAIG